MADPLRPANGAANLGAAGLARTTPTSGERWELGTVIQYNSGTHTSLVRTNKGRPLEDVPQIRSTSGGFDHLEPGTSVVVSWDLGVPVIVGILDLVGPPQSALPSPSLTDIPGVGSDDPTQTTQGSNNYKPPYAPTDMGGGDWAQVGKHGQHVAVLDGGVAQLGSPTAKVQSFGQSGVLRSIARRVETVTDFGHWRAENVEGRTSFVMRAGSNQSTETGLDEQHWTIRLDLGATGDVLDFKITDPQGKTLFRLHAGSDGRVQLYGDGGVDVSAGAGGTSDLRHDVAGARSTSVAGSDTHEVQGDAAVTVDGSSTTTIVGDATRNIGRNSTDFVSGTHAHGVGGDETHVVAGRHDVHVGGAEEHVVDGALKITGKKDIAIDAASNVTVTAKGTAKVTGASIILGPSGAHPLPKWDSFLADFSGFIGALNQAIGSLVPSDPFSLAFALVRINIFAAKVGMSFPYTSTKVRND